MSKENLVGGVGYGALFLKTGNIFLKNRKHLFGHFEVSKFKFKLFCVASKSPQTHDHD